MSAVPRPAAAAAANTPATKPSLTLKRRLKAPPAKVYAAWTDPAQIARWWGPKQTDEVTKAEIDLRVGGGFRIVFRDGDEENDVSGVYREVMPVAKLVFTWAWRSTPERESLVTVALAPDGAGTLMTFTHEQFFDEAARDRHHQGWQGAFDKLERCYP